MALEGLSPRVDSCVKCGQPLEGEARFSAAMGGAACVWCAPASPAISMGPGGFSIACPPRSLTPSKSWRGIPTGPEAARFFRAYLKTRLSLPEKQYPPLSINPIKNVVRLSLIRKTDGILAFSPP